MRFAAFGGIYSNSPALEAAIADAEHRGAEQLYCLGDLGAFGPHPDRVFPLLFDHSVRCVQGNYDHSLGNGLDDCRCGYTDPRDNHFAAVSYRYTFQHTSPEHREWLGQLPAEIRFTADGLRFLLCHGSPRKTNEFVWESTASTHFLDRLVREAGADVVLGTHTGLHWHRALPEGRLFANVGVLGRPENDGRTNVWYLFVSTGDDAVRRHTAVAATAGEGTGPDCCYQAEPGPVLLEFVPLEYDYRSLADDMRSEGLPEEFVETILTGWWTTCLEVLPARERRGGRY